MRLLGILLLLCLVSMACADDPYVVSSGAYVSSVRVVHRDGAYVLAWTEWTGEEVIGKLATFGASCAPASAPREIFRLPARRTTEGVADYPVLLALDARESDVALVTHMPNTSDDRAILWLVGDDVRSVPLGHASRAAILLADDRVEVAYTNTASTTSIAIVDRSTLEVTRLDNAAAPVLIEPGFGSREDALALGKWGQIWTATATRNVDFLWGERAPIAGAFSTEEFGVLTEDGERSELLEITRGGTFLSHRRFPQEHVRGSVFDAGEVAVAWYDVVDDRRRAILYTPPLSLEAFVVAELDESVVSLEHDGDHSTLDGAFDGTDEVLIAYTSASDAWHEPSRFRPTDLHVRCIASDGGDLERSSRTLSFDRPQHDPSSCEGGYTLSDPFYARSDGGFSLSLQAARDVTTTCSAFESEDAMVRFVATVAGTYTFTAEGSPGGLEARTACGDPDTAIACELDTSYHSETPWAVPLEIRVPLEAGQEIWLVVEGFSAELRAYPPVQTGDACSDSSSCSGGMRCISGLCTTPTAPVLETAIVLFYEGEPGSTDQRLMVQAIGSDLTRDVQTILVFPEGASVPLRIGASASALSFRLKARSYGEAVPRSGTVRVVLEDSAGLRSEPLTVQVEPAPVLGPDQVCDPYEIENVCARELTCSLIPGGGTSLCRNGGF